MDYTSIYNEITPDEFKKILSLQSPHLRNLAWILCSKPLSITLEEYFPSENELDWLHREWDWFENENENPTDIEKFIKNNLSNSRLGFYAENLLYYWFEKNENFRLLEKGTQINFNGRTLTEIDFFFHDLVHAQYYFWETTLKFYLLEPVSRDWIGPGSNDKASLKLKKAKELQIYYGKKYLEEKYGFKFKTTLFMKGRLFSPFDNEVNWMKWSEFLALQNKFEKHLLLPKEDWMFLNCIHQIENHSQSRELNKITAEIKKKKSALIFKVNSLKKPTLTFIVTDYWPHSC